MKTQNVFWKQATQVEVKGFSSTSFEKVLERSLSAVQRTLGDWLDEDVPQKDSVTAALSFNLTDAEMDSLMNDPSLDD